MTTEKLIINGVDHSVFNLEWAKRGGVVFHTYDSGYSIFWSFFQGAIYGLAGHHPKIGYRIIPHEKRYLDLATNQEYKMMADRMATPAECETAGIEYIEYHGWRPIESAPKHQAVLVWIKGATPCAAAQDDDGWYEPDLEEELGFNFKPSHWMPLQQVPKDE